MTTTTNTRPALDPRAASRRLAECIHVEAALRQAGRESEAQHLHERYTKMETQGILTDNSLLMLLVEYS